jgi:hypothetical protein
VTRRPPAVLALLLALAAASCKDGPTAGELNVRLMSPNSDDGAIHFRASAATPNTITGMTAACASCKLFQVKVSDTDYRGVLTGDITAGTVLRLAVTDTKAEGYTVQVVAVASRTSQLRAPLAYSLTLD